MRFIIFLLVLSCSSPFKPKNWGIQLQGYEKSGALEKIRESKLDLWVVDYFPKTQVRLLKANEKKLICYMSIGEAEDYRPYFKILPKGLLGKANPEFPNNFSVDFWKPEWQGEFLKPAGYMDQILAAGFDGVFLDVIDAFERYPDREAKAQEMAKFVEKISRHGKAKKKDFLVILQNGVHIRRFVSNPEAFVQSIDGVNVESVFQNPETLAYLRDDIKFYQSHQKFILSLEYLQEPKQVKEYFSHARQLGVVPLAAERNLAGQGIQPFE